MIDVEQDRKRKREEEMLSRIKSVMDQAGNLVGFGIHDSLRDSLDITHDRSPATSSSSTSTSTSTTNTTGLSLDSFFAPSDGRLNEWVDKYHSLADKHGKLTTKYGKSKRDYVNMDKLKRDELSMSRELEEQLFVLKTELASCELEIIRLREANGQLAMVLETRDAEEIEFAKRARQDREQAVRDALNGGGGGGD